MRPPRPFDSRRSAGRVHVLDGAAFPDQSVEPSPGRSVVGARRALPVQRTERLPHTRRHPRAVAAHVHPGARAEQFPDLGGVGGDAVLDEGHAVLRGGAEGGAQRLGNREPPEQSPANVAPTEARILALLAGGATTARAARETGLTVDGVNYYLRRLSARWGAANRTELVARVCARGVLVAGVWPPEPTSP